LYVSGVDFDFNGNLWVSNFGAVRPISVRLANGNWQSFALPSNINNAFGFITCDDYGNKWIINTRGLGLCVFRENIIGNNNDDQVKVLTTDKQNGALPSNTVFCVTNDKKGELWVGTSKGLCIFSNPGNVFKTGADFDAQQIVIKAGLIFSNFLDDVPIYCIKVDNANRKWIGTSNGVWLVSSDGFTVIRNFTRLNSPLLANAVYEIGIDEHTGEVFFVTEKGIVSYMGTATAGAENFNDVKIYPNPVTPEYDGSIAITGLVENCYVKITDLSGSLVYENRANGGMLTWDGINYSGNKVATGVYLIFASDSEGTLTHANKLLIIR
jgi:ligand-binding sensor domain-containing protein